LIRALVVVGLAVVLDIGTAGAETIVEVPKSTATLTLQGGWNRVAHTFKGIVEIYKHDSGSNLAVTRADVPNPDAWVEGKRQAYVDKVEDGIRKSVPGYKRVAKKIVDANGVPALDLEARSRAGATIVVRVLLYRTYSVSAAIEVPERGDVAAARAIVKTLAPPKRPKPPAK
jgi:hypothetical protein